jgi:transcriptional regulator with GAF, ATPase, and Fis domain
VIFPVTTLNVNRYQIDSKNVVQLIILSQHHPVAAKNRGNSLARQTLVCYQNDTPTRNSQWQEIDFVNTEKTKDSTLHGYKLRELKALADMNKEIQGAHSIELLLKNLVEQAIIGVNFERGLIYLVEGDYLRCVAALDRIKKADASILRKKVGFSLSENGLETLAVHSRATQYTENAKVDARVSKKFLKYSNSHAYCVVPLIGRRGVLGVFTADKPYSKEEIGPEDIKTLELFASHISLAIENANLHETTMQFNKTLENSVREKTQELAEANQALSVKMQELSALYEVSNLLNKSMESVDILNYTLSLMHDFGYDYCAIHSQEHTYLPDSINAAALGSQYQEILHRDPLLRENLELNEITDPRNHMETEEIARTEATTAAFFRAKGLTRFALIPIIAGRLLATLVVYLPAKEEISEENKRFLSAVVKHVGVALGRSLKLQRVTRERDRAEKVTEKLERENTYMKDRLKSQRPPNNIVGVDSSLKGVMELVYKVAPTSATVTLFGESGTGKELIAQAIHALSPRMDCPIIAVNCAAIPEDLLESELFGYEKGAFTGADKSRAGLFELANGGTLFLDEIGEISAKTQSKLLRVLQEKELRRLGSQQSIKVDTRVIAATNSDLKNSEFRSDLFYRLNVFPVNIPPLRERIEDLEPLIRFFSEKHSKSRHPLRFTQDALESLKCYSWPGNIRELENMIERLAIITETGRITQEDLPKEILQTTSASQPVSFLAEAIRDFQKDMVMRALSQAGGKKAQAARMLGMQRSNFSRLTKSLGL